jgi:hypothetical protein
MDIENPKKRRGRPATGRVLDGSVFIRCPKDKVDGVKWAVKEFLSGPIRSDVECEELREFNSRLLADVDRLEKEKAELLARPKEEMNLDYKELYLEAMRELEVLRGRKRSEFDQT